MENEWKLGNLMEMYGKLMENLWKTNGKHMEHHRTTNGELKEKTAN